MDSAMFPEGSIGRIIKYIGRKSSPEWGVYNRVVVKWFNTHCGRKGLGVCHDPSGKLWTNTWEVPFQALRLGRSEDKKSISQAWPSILKE